MLFGTGGSKMGMNKRRMQQEKVMVVLEFLNASTSAVKLCRKYNVSPATFQDWNDKFMADGKGRCSLTVLKCSAIAVLTLKVQLESLSYASPNRLPDLRFEIHFA